MMFAYCISLMSKHVQLITTVTMVKWLKVICHFRRHAQLHHYYYYFYYDAVPLPLLLLLPEPLLLLFLLRCSTIAITITATSTITITISITMQYHCHYFYCYQHHYYYYFIALTARIIALIRPFRIHLSCVHWATSIFLSIQKIMNKWEYCHEWLLMTQKAITIPECLQIVHSFRYHPLISN